MTVAMVKLAHKVTSICLYMVENIYVLPYNAITYIYIVTVHQVGVKEKGYILHEARGWHKISLSPDQL